MAVERSARSVREGLTQIAATADALSLESVAAMAGLAIVSRGRAHAEIQVAVQDFDIESAVATGSWDAQDVNIPPLQAEKAHGKLRIAGGLARFDEILLEREGGRAEASVEFRLDDPRFLFLELTSRQWPVRLEGNPLLLYADGRAHLRVNLVERTADGEARLSGTCPAQRTGTRAHSRGRAGAGADVERRGVLRRDSRRHGGGPGPGSPGSLDGQLGQAAMAGYPAEDC